MVVRAIGWFLRVAIKGRYKPQVRLEYLKRSDLRDILLEARNTDNMSLRLLHWLLCLDVESNISHI